MEQIHLLNFINKLNRTCKRYGKSTLLKGKIREDVMEFDKVISRTIRESVVRSQRNMIKPK